MSAIDPAELSALLDGELPVKRAEEIRQALRMDPALATTYEGLIRLDAEWKAHAAGLAFLPRASLRRGLLRRFLRTGSIMLGLVGVRLGLKFAPPSLEMAAALAVLVLVVGWGLTYLINTSDEDSWWLARRPVNSTA
jgi:anti-sigma factor RsiW